MTEKLRRPGFLLGAKRRGNLHRSATTGWGLLRSARNDMKTLGEPDCPGHSHYRPNVCRSCRHASLKSRNGSTCLSIQFARISSIVMFGARYPSTTMRHTQSAASTTCGDDIRRDSVGQCIDTDQPGYIVPPILHGIGIQFCRLVQKPAEQRGSRLPLGGKPLGPDLRMLRCP